MDIRLHPEDIKELAQEIVRLQMDKKKENEVVYLDELAEETKIGVQKLKKMRVEKHIPKVDGAKKIAILGKYVPQLLAS